MSDGGGESSRKHDQQLHAKRKFGGDDFAQAIAKIAVAQICGRVGFQSFQQSALRVLSDIAVRYIHSIGTAANSFANLAGRTECNALDIFQGLEDLGSAQGFSGASDIHHCLSSSGIVRELIQYASEAQDDPPFAYSLPHFPVAKERKPKLSFMEIGEEPPSKHIPAWLPAFSDLQTYVQLPTQNDGAAESYAEKLELGRQQRKVEMSMLNLQQHFTGNGPEGPSSVPHGDNTKEKQAAESNPFLSAPLHFEEKPVSSVFLPTKFSKEVVLKSPFTEKHVVGNHISVMETFVPVIETMKNRFCDSEEEQKRILSDQRPPVQFKVGIGKKLLGKPLQLSLQYKDVQKKIPSFCKDNEKDERKRQAEEILKDSMENAQELAQL